ncbi:unnamed protein product, partial [Owenia fusiformis]
MGELGRFPLFINIFYQQVKYLDHIENEGTSSLLINAYADSIELSKVHNQPSWYYDIDRIMAYVQPQDKISMNSKPLDIKKILEKRYIKYWEKTVNDNKGKFEF